MLFLLTYLYTRRTHLEFGNRHAPKETSSRGVNAPKSNNKYIKHRVSAPLSQERRTTATRYCVARQEVLLWLYAGSTPWPLTCYVLILLLRCTYKIGRLFSNSNICFAPVAPDMDKKQFSDFWKLRHFSLFHRRTPGETFSTIKTTRHHKSTSVLQGSFMVRVLW